MNHSRLALGSLFLLLLWPSVFSLAQQPKSVASETPPISKKVAIARVWHGRTPSVRADEYYTYLNDAGIKQIQAIDGNLGVQVFRRNTGEVTEFTVISYWASLDAIKRFAGDDVEKTHNLLRDSEYLLELEPTVKHHEVLLNDWKR